MFKLKKRSKEKDLISCNFCRKRDYDIIYEIESMDRMRSQVLYFCPECAKEIISILGDELNDRNCKKI